jgi:hypothetical protein
MQALSGETQTEDHTGDYNIAMGKLSLENNTSGYLNIAIGTSALAQNTTGSQNISIGGGLGGNTTGTRNIGIGSAAGRSVKTTSGTVAIGPGAILNATGTRNTAIGDSSLYNLRNGSYNTTIGSNTEVINPGATINNSTAIGYGTIISGSNQIRVGNASVASIGGQVGWTTLSDKRVKRDIKSDVPGLAFIKLLEPVTYQFNIQEQNRLLGVESDDGEHDNSDIQKIRFSGFLAQDVEQAAKSIGYEFSGIDKSGVENGGLYSLRYAEFTVPLVKAVQELNHTIEQQQKVIDELKAEIEQIKQLLVK